MNLSELIEKLREEAERVNSEPNWLRIAADMIEHLQEERVSICATNERLEKIIHNLGDELCFVKSRLPFVDNEGQCEGCAHIVSCPIEKMAVNKFSLKTCSERKVGENEQIK